MAVDSLTKEIHIEAPPSVVFQFLTDPARLARWMGARAEINSKPGGLYSLDLKEHDEIRGEYLEAIPNARVVFTWGWKEAWASSASASTRVEIHLQAEGKGTRVRLTHRPGPLLAHERDAPRATR